MTRLFAILFAINGRCGRVAVYSNLPLIELHSISPPVRAERRIANLGSLVRFWRDISQRTRNGCSGSSTAQNDTSTLGQVFIREQFVIETKPHSHFVPTFQFQLPIMATVTIQAPIVIIRIRPTQYATGCCSRAFWASVPDFAPMRPGITDDQISTITPQIMNIPTTTMTSVLIVSIIFAGNANPP
jgi:hypothetical protein